MTSDNSSELYLDASETRAPEAREAALMLALGQQLVHAKTKTSGYAEILADVEPQAITDRAGLASLPVTRKSDLLARQKAEPPFGGLTALTASSAARYFASPGPIYEPAAARSDYWRCTRALYAAGFRSGDVVHNSFSYHLTPGGWIMDSGARALGCVVVPAGVGNSEQQVAAIAQFSPVGYTGTPDFLKVLLDRADEAGTSRNSICRALVSGAALPASLRGELARRGVSVLQCYATADLGVISYETKGLDGKPGEGMVINEDLIVEIVRPGTGDPLPVGEVGEVIVTTLNPDYPLIRFATGDLSAILPGASLCGRTNHRLRGWMGRADQTTKVKGMFVHPGQVAEVVRRHPEVHRARLVVERQNETDVMTLCCDAPDLLEQDRDDFATAISRSLVEVCKVRGEVTIVQPGSLPNDGKVIEDARPIS